MTGRQTPRHLDQHFLALVEDLRGIVWNSSGKGKIGWGTLAGEARLCVATVSRFADGTTRLPTGNTLFMLSKACGYRFALVKSQTGVAVFGEVKPGQFKNDIPRQVQNKGKRGRHTTHQRAARSR